MNNQKLVIIFLRISIASVFLYAAIASTLEPYNWIGYLPQSLKTIFPAQQLLMVFSVYEFLLSVWVLSGWKSFYAASLSGLTLIGIITGNITEIDIVFRDLAILFSSIALAVGSYKKDFH